MKLSVYSDLHLEFGGWEYEHDGEDVAIFAGDIHVGTKGAYWLAYIAKQYPDTDFIYIAGNHEYYRHDLFDLDDKIDAVLKDIPNVHYLDNEVVEIKGQAFFGGTCWTDLPEKSAPFVIQSMNDFRLIKNMNYDNWIIEHEKFISELNKVKQKYDQLIVVSHHAPTYASVADIYREGYSALLNDAYYTNLEEYMGNISLWVHGHTHHSFDYELDGTKVLCNPRGYDGHELNPEFKSRFTIDIGD